MASDEVPVRGNPKLMIGIHVDAFGVGAGVPSLLRAATTEIAIA